MKRTASWLLAITIAVFCSTAVAQIGNASLAGTVRDTTGAVVPNAMVTVHNTATDVDKTVPSNGSGVYVFPSLITGPTR